MGILTRHIRGATATPGMYPGDPALASLFGGRTTSSGQHVNSDTAMRVSTVYACVTVLSQTLAMLPLNVKCRRSDGGKDISTDHRLHKQLMYRPNKWQTSFEWREMMQGHVLLRGNAYSQIVSSPGRGLNELVPLHPDRVWPFILLPDGSAYYLTPETSAPPAGSRLFYLHIPLWGGQEVLMDSEVFHLKAFSSNGILGLNPIQLHRESIGLSMATEEHGARLFSNGAQIAKAFSHPGKLGDVAYERLKKSIDGEFAGASNAHKTMILEEGMKVEKIGMTSEDSQFLETRKYQVEDIARIFHTPLILIGHSDKASTYASAEQFFSSFITNTMNPWFSRWEQAIQRDLMYPSELGTISADFDESYMLRGDSAAMAAYFKARFEVGSISPDEIRAREGENPIPNGSGGRYYVPANMLPSDQAREQGGKE